VLAIANFVSSSGLLATAQAVFNSTLIVSDHTASVVVVGLKIDCTLATL
jgi:hypothetical protein